MLNKQSLGNIDGFQGTILYFQIVYITGVILAWLVCCKRPALLMHFQVFLTSLHLIYTPIAFVLFNEESPEERYTSGQAVQITMLSNYAFYMTIIATSFVYAAFIVTPLFYLG
jgi:hypothetical protein